VQAERTGTYPTTSTAVGVTPDGFWVQNDADIVLLDRAVTPVGTVPIGTAWQAAHAVAPGGSHVAVSDREEIRLVDRTGAVVWRFPHTPWGTGYSIRGSCGITGDGRTVYASVPETDLLFDEYADVAAYGEDGDDGQGTYGDQWIAFDAATGAPTRWWFKHVADQRRHRPGRLVAGDPPGPRFAATRLIHSAQARRSRLTIFSRANSMESWRTSSQPQSRCCGRQRAVVTRPRRPTEHPWRPVRA
jgi:hypothetical protein